MDIPYYQINTFTNNFNAGNPAGVCPIEKWLADETMQAIAKENNLSETAFFVCNENEYELRWFTPTVEVDLCGHATLASAYVLFNETGIEDDKITFNTRSGKLVVSKSEHGIAILLPVATLAETTVPRNLVKGLNAEPVEAYKDTDYLLVFESEKIVRDMQPDFNLIKNIDLRGTIVTAPSSEKGVDFVSRFFGSVKVGIEEDPATGSAHCALAPYWTKRLAKNRLNAWQVSERGAEIFCELQDQKVSVSGTAVTYLKGYITI